MWDESLWRAGTSSRTGSCTSSSAADSLELEKLKPWAASFQGEHLSLITAQLPRGVCRGSVPPPLTAQPGISSLEYFHSSCRAPLICKPSVQQREQGSCSCDLASGWHFLLPALHPPGSAAHVIPPATGQIRAGKSRRRRPGNTRCTHLFMAGVFKAPRLLRQR